MSHGADPGPEPTYRSVLIEADGGSRGNPGQAAYGAVLLDAATGATIAEKAERIGIATNNVAEYRGLIAGLELYREHAEGADLEVRMDSKLVVEQMSGRWKIKHPDMKPLAMQANRLAPAGTRYTWIPRERNKHADRILNEVLDGTRAPGATATAVEEDVLGEPAESAPAPRPPADLGTPTTLVLVRHGETDLTREHRFSGRGGSDPGLNDTGRAQVRATADWLAPLAEEVHAVVASPLRRTRESADIVAERIGRTVDVEDGLAEAAFGTWDGLTYAEARALDARAFDAWMGSLDVPAGGSGDSMTSMEKRVRQVRDRLIRTYPGQTVVVVSHLTPINLLVRSALEAPLTATYRLEVAPASVTVVAWYADGNPVVRMLNARPTDAAW